MKKLLPFALVTLALASCDKKEAMVEPTTVEYVAINQSFKLDAPIYLDVNKDGRNDFVFGNILVSDARGAHNLFYMSSIDGNEVLLDEQPSKPHIGHWTVGLQEGETVLENKASNQVWSTDKAYLLDIRKPDERFTYFEGPAASETTPYVAVRFKDGDSSKSGWIKLKYEAGDDKLQVIAAGVSKTENQALAAGRIK